MSGASRWIVNHAESLGSVLGSSRIWSFTAEFWSDQAQRYVCSLDVGIL